MIKDIIFFVLSLFIRFLNKLQYLVHPIKDDKVTSWKIIKRVKGKLQFLNENVFFCSYMKSESISHLLTSNLVVLDYSPEKVVALKCPKEIYNVEKYPFFYDAIYHESTEKLVVPFRCFIDIVEKEPWPQVNVIFLWSIGRCGSTLLGNLFTTFEGFYTISEPCDLFNVAKYKNRLTPEEMRKTFKVALKYHMIQTLNCFPDMKTVIIKGKSMDFWYIARSALEIKDKTTHIFMYRDLQPTLKSFQKAFGSNPDAKSLIGKFFGVGTLTFNSIEPLEDMVAECGFQQIAEDVVKIRKSSENALVRLLFGGMPLTVFLYKHLAQSGYFGRQLFGVKYERLIENPVSYFEKIAKKMSGVFEINSAERQKLLDISQRDSQQNSQLSKKSLEKRQDIDADTKEIEEKFREIMVACGLRQEMEPNLVLPQSIL